ncbi:hypothetical protein H9P43_008061 [Blastocladiella emersonii ATCC 22665]|nr:hypothetical protein H9P43_008061 [Blastocladiella emersonii ATCC 22665]
MWTRCRGLARVLLPKTPAPAPSVHPEVLPLPESPPSPLYFPDAALNARPIRFAWKRCKNCTSPLLHRVRANTKIRANSSMTINQKSVKPDSMCCGKDGDVRAFFVDQGIVPNCPPALLELIARKADLR